MTKAGLLIPTPAPSARPARRREPLCAIVIGASTGGLSGVTTICKIIRDDIRRAVVLVAAHLPLGFASSIASHIALASGAPVHVSVDNTVAEPGHVYLAASGVHLTVGRAGGKVILRHDAGAFLNGCRPAADPLFITAADVYAERVACVVLSGNGIDGLAGARAVAGRGGIVLAQDRATSAAWGMPGAVVEHAIAEAALPPVLIGHRLRNGLKPMMGASS